MIWKGISEWFKNKMLEIKILEVVPLWVIGLYLNIGVIKNDNQDSGGEKGNKSRMKPPMNEMSIVDDCNVEGVWSDQGGC